MTERITHKKSALTGKDVILYQFIDNDGTTFSGIYHSIAEAHSDRSAWLIARNVLAGRAAIDVEEINPGIPIAFMQ